VILADVGHGPPDGEAELDRGCLPAAEPTSEHECEGVHRFEDRFHGQDGTAAHSRCRLGASLAPNLSFGVLKREAHEFSTKVSARMRFCTTRAGSISLTWRKTVRYSGAGLDGGFVTAVVELAR
jgi:hypothetical protein